MSEVRQRRRDRNAIAGFDAIQSNLTSLAVSEEDQQLLMRRRIFLESLVTTRKKGIFK